MSKNSLKMKAQMKVREIERVHSHSQARTFTLINWVNECTRDRIKLNNNNKSINKSPFILNRLSALAAALRTEVCESVAQSLGPSRDLCVHTPTHPPTHSLTRPTSRAHQTCGYQIRAHYSTTPKITTFLSSLFFSI